MSHDAFAAGSGIRRLDPFTGGAFAAELSLVSGSVGKDIEELRAQLDDFEKEPGHTVKIVEMPASTTDQFG